MTNKLFLQILAISLLLAAGVWLLAIMMWPSVSATTLELEDWEKVNNMRYIDANLYLAAHRTEVSRLDALKSVFSSRRAILLHLRQLACYSGTALFVAFATAFLIMRGRQDSHCKDNA
jgi:hypothetical protein